MLDLAIRDGLVVDGTGAAPAALGASGLDCGRIPAPALAGGGGSAGSRPVRSPATGSIGTSPRGYAVDHLEHEPFVNCIACPVLGADGRVLGAIAITTTTLVCTYEEMLDLRPVLAATAEAVSSEYGWRQEPERREAVA